MPSGNRLTLVKAWFEPDWLLRIEYRRYPSGVVCATSFLRRIAEEYGDDPRNDVARIARDYWRYVDACRSIDVAPSVDGFERLQAVRDRLRPQTAEEQALGTLTRAWDGVSTAVLATVSSVDHASAQLRQLVDAMAKAEDIAFKSNAHG